MTHQMSGGVEVEEEEENQEEEDVTFGRIYRTFLSHTLARRVMHERALLNGHTCALFLFTAPYSCSLVSHPRGTDSSIGFYISAS